ncbi:NfeD family protein [Qipengyuania qiaonensis]|uniref:NfeD family protein n=1 Tax=Qipengyuania qiaonensis TaxID=2867240 RepID=A0ABS7J9E0_9SPHN|nr:NfeD family protein [Qipengyuania qiaonensis]MBX7481587.1 NfeD family protein [Qipengyuania qiaonensis]
MDGIETYWIWLIVGLALAALEMVVPGVYLIWLAMAALSVAVLAFVSAPPLALQIIAWVSLSLIFAFSAKRWLRERPIVSSDPLLNNRVGRLVGETALVTQAIESGSGRVKVGDSEWIARGTDTDAGMRVRIIGSRGSELLVEPVALIEGDTAEDG